MKITLNQPALPGENFLVRQKPVPDGNSCGMSTLMKTLMKLHLIVLLLVVGLSQVGATGYAQQITLKRRNSSLENILKEVERQSGYAFFYKEAEVLPIRNVSVDIENMSLREALGKIVVQSGFTYDIFQKTVVVKKSTVGQSIKLGQGKNMGASANVAEQQQYIKGRVVDESGKGIAGASIRLKSDGRKAVVSQANGEFSLPIAADKETLIISFVGYATKEITADAGKQPLTVRLEVQGIAVDEVVVTGMMNFDKKTFSGATATYSGEELKMVGNTNVIQSLRSLDPSFLLMENNIAGSNPNMLPTIELRGQSSISTESLRDDFSGDPNQPLFILDGFETTLRNIIDLDMNRVASITLLKDAGSTAIYGSRASNGVVVVETIKPKAGKVRLSYTSDLNLELADLSGYNMMNAAEKLEFERLSGIYTASTSTPEQQDLYLTPRYSKRLQDVLSGVNSYWLSEPIQTGFSQRHSLYAEGGSDNLFFNAGGNYKKQRGVMIGSGREEWGGRLNLTYRAGKLNINNNAYVNGALGTESPYGTFSTWVNTNPYYAKLDENTPYLEEYTDYDGLVYKYKVNNPIYNAHLTSFDKTKTFGLTNNLQLIYQFSPKLRVTGSVQLGQTSTESNNFKSPMHTDFLQVADFLKRGTYTFRNRRDFSYTSSLMLTYANVFKEKHSVTLNGRTEISNTNNTMKGFNAEGFPNTSNGNPAFAYGYTEDGKPYSSNATKRRNSIMATGSYTYDRRYTVDASFNYDGSTAFGQNNLYSPFYSIGASWNLKNESFLKDNAWLSNLRLRMNYGVNGNQNFSSTTSLTTYTYSNQFNLNGQGVLLSTLGNPDLKWQNTYNTNLGLDASFMGNRASVVFDVYRKLTDPQVVAVDLPLSTGLSAYPFNAGELLVKGVEATLRFAPIYRPADRVVWNISLNGSLYKQRYDGFGDRLKTLNESLQESSSLQRYYDGSDPADMWAVKSLGIDPATGREIFLKKDGTQSFQYSKEDLQIVGNSRPAIQGVFNTNFTYKSFTASAIFRYILDQDVMNSALFEKVENISRGSVITKNQDKRALYERWKQPGDQSEFKAISITATTPISSRFIQQENTLSLESVSLAYDFKDSFWIKSLGLTNLRLTGYTNDIFRLSTIKRERGISYPYARSVSFSLSANFK